MKIEIYNPLNAQLNPIYQLLALLEAHHILHVSRMRVKVIRAALLNVKDISTLRRANLWDFFGVWKKCIAPHVLGQGAEEDGLLKGYLSLEMKVMQL